MAGFMVRQRRKGEQGYAYIALLIFIAAMGVALAVTGEVWSMAMKREKEEQLIFAGNQFRNALTMYYVHTPAHAGRYPMSLEDLLKDPRYPAARRYLRKIYPDPVSGTASWELIKGANGEILGVHSTSDEEPVKKSNFSLADQDFEGKMKYSEWLFMIPVKNIQPSLLKSPAMNSDSSPSGMFSPGAPVPGLNP
jgi:type II secretory pathway pseudopilin PulG